MSALAWIGEYPYLAVTLVLCAIVPLYLVAAGPHRRAAAWSGLQFLPLGFTASLLGGDYWAADRLGGLSFGMEDFLYFGQLGVASWFFASLPFGLRLATDIRPAAMTPRALLVAAAGTLGLAAGLATGLSAIVWALGLWAVLVAAFLAWRPSLWRLALSAGLLHGVAYAVLLQALLPLWPDLAKTWVASHPLVAADLFGVPLGDVLWGILAPAALALAYGFIVRARFAPPAAARPASTASPQRASGMPLTRPRAASPAMRIGPPSTPSRQCQRHG